MTTIVFEVLAEGGSLSIERIISNTGTKFIYHHQEIDFTDEGLAINKNGEYETFEQAFQIINHRFPWYKLHLHIVHEDYRAFVLKHLLFALNKNNITPMDWQHAKIDAERALQIQLEYAYTTLENGLQKIKVKNLIELTEYDYQEFSDQYAQKIGQKYKLNGTYKMWTDEQTFDPIKMEVLNVSNSFEIIGKLEVVANTVIIKNEHDHILHVFPSDKFSVSSSMLMRPTKSWFCRTLS